MLLSNSNKISDILKKHNCTNIKPYNLVNNSGCTFELNGIEFDARHWKNVYGTNVDYWDISITKDITEESKAVLQQIKQELNDNCR